MSEWQPIETAPMNGTVFQGCSLDPERPFESLDMKWGVGARPDENYICNNGNPWWIRPDGRYMVARPTHWKPTP